MAEITGTNNSNSKMGFMQAMVRGRIEATRIYDGVRFTRLITPAPDSYSRPQVVEIRSTSSLGFRGEEINCLVKLGGFTRKPYKVKDSETGEITTITPVDMTLEAI